MPLRWVASWLGVGGAPVNNGGFRDERTVSVPPNADHGRILRGRRLWQLVRPIGMGRQGTVWLASPPSDERELVALKRLALQDGERNDARREISALLAISSDRIPRVVDWRIDGDDPFLAMTFYGKGSLRKVLQVSGALEEEAVWRLLKDLLVGLRAAHTAGLLHLDVKPANVLLDDDGGFVLTDFGVSQAAHAGAPLGVGTRGYQAPEQVSGTNVDLRADLYAAGATAWAAWTGVNPAAERTAAVLQAAGPDHGLPPPTSLRALGSPALERVILRLVSRRPAERPGSADEALALLESARASVAPPAEAGLGHEVPVGTARSILDLLVDPLWIQVLGAGDARGMRRFPDGEVLAREGERAWWTYILLEGAVRIERGGKVLAVEAREGAFLGEVATLTGHPRTATMTAVGEVWTWPLNAAELESLITVNPAVGLRLVRAMAERLAQHGS